ncbi:hypothetical protein [Flavobacterium humi]|uniref:Lipoprotein n=1 Tax=Flavobacterium humi TaxID=2562683 RepID=A0A4Z0LCH9_9FLAO|nr:hypothetical protein [Flavobacterium humi]TGD59578.1 hypothetical protein E4635_01190 [Flavobacterium humi]
MKKIVVSVICLFLGIVFFSCKKEDQKAPESEATTTETTPVHPETAKKAPREIQVSKTEKLTSEIVSETAAAKAKLNKENAVSVYKDFRQEIETIIGQLNDANANILDEYYQFYDQKTARIVLSGAVKTKVKSFTKANVEIWEIGEGMAEIRTVPNFYLDIFKNDLPEDYVAYLKLEAFDNTTLYAADAGFVISLKEVSDRVINWENFLAKYPESMLYPEAKEAYKDYLTNYLYGLDNTANFDYENMTLYPESQKEFEEFMAKYPASTATKITKVFTDAFARKVTPDELNALIRTEETKYPITK